jgi:hypothetical protein
LAYRDRLAHLIFRQPAPLIRQFAPHLTDKGDWAAEAKQAEAKKVAHDLSDPTARSFGGACHANAVAMRLTRASR